MMKKLRSSCSYALAAFVILMLLPWIGRGQTTINLDNAANWIQDGTLAFTSYGNHAYSESGVTIQGTNVLRNTTALQDLFPGALGTYSMRIENTAVSKVVISIATGGLADFSIKVRRWDNNPMPNYTVKYSIDGGTIWNSLTNIDGTLLTNSDFFLYSSGIINSTNSNIQIEIKNTGTTERIMIDDFTWTGYAGGGNIVPSITNIIQTPSTAITSSTTVSVSADITDSDGTVTAVELHWGTTTGSLTNTIAMSNGGSGDTYTTAADIPVQAIGTTVFYEIAATDNEPAITTTTEYSYDVTTPVADFVMINEVDADQTSTDTQEFIELFDGGTGNTNLSGLVVVLYNGSTDLSYAAYDLDGYSTDANGYFVLGSSIVPNVDLVFPGASDQIQNGADAVALFAGNGIDFPTGSAVTTINLVDALVYGTADADDAGLLVLLNPGEPQVDESSYANSVNQSMQRIPNGSGGLRNTSTYDETDPTPGAENFIPIVEPITSIWNGSISSDWFEVSNWTNDPVDANVPPGAATNVGIPVVATNYPTITAVATCNNITIASGASLIDENNYLSVSGTATVNRTISDATDDKWHLFISPVQESTQASAGSCFGGAYVDGYNETTGAWDRLATDDNVTSGQGYAINYLTGIRDLVFTGTLQSSPVSYTDLSYTSSSAVDDNYGAGWHLVGNPYPCGINPALCSLPTNMNAFAYVWNGGNYITPSIGSADVIGTIASLQGFFVRTTNASNSFSLSNAAKVHGGTFFKSSNSASQMLSLSIVGNNYSDKTYVRFNTEATANFDQAFDAYKKAGLDVAPQLYSLLPDEKAAVNTLPGYINNPNVSLGLKVGAEAVYTLNVDGFDSFETSLPIRLDDLKLGTTQDLRLNPVYSFTAAPGDDENRFMLSFASVTAVDPLQKTGLKVVAEKGFIRVTHNAPASGTVYLYSVSGQLLATKKLNVGETSLHTATTGVFMVKVVTTQATFTQKLVVVQ